MWKYHVIVTTFCLVQLNCEGKMQTNLKKDIENVCSATCDICTDLVTDLMRSSNTCSRRCKCLDNIHKMVSEKDKFQCKAINNEIFCKLGRKIDDNGCATDSCNTWLPCSEENPLANCSHPCPHGYRMDLFGCPLCDCRCKADEIGYKTFVHECAMKCNNRYNVVSPRTKTCPLCNCTAVRKVQNKQSCKEVPICPKNCGSWGVLYKCDSKENSCRCDCPATKIDCRNMECAWGSAAIAKDEFDCIVGCNCPEENKVETILPKEMESKCPMSIKCPLECGPYPLKRIYDFRGCLRECRCECIDPLCHRPCPDNKIMKDIYGCPTCDCLPDWTHCPIVCNISCGFHNRLLPNDERGCPSTCDCNCPRTTSHQNEKHMSDIPRPPLMCPVICDKLEISRDRFGCDHCKCKSLRCPRLRCQKNCGPHGFIEDKNECQTCDCNCPRIDLCAPCSRGRYLRDGYGCETCNCECPMLIGCEIDCLFGRVINEMGCELCQCADKPHSGRRRVDNRDDECEEKECDLDCEFYKRSPRGCKKCQCCEPLDCPGLNCESGILRVNKDQCPICRCARIERKSLTSVISSEEKRCPSMSDCKIKCPKLFLKVDQNHCPICECCEPILKRDCPFLRCNKFQTNGNGCPICECEDETVQQRVREESAKDKERKCPEKNCPHICKESKLDDHGCRTCECCTNFLNDCKELKCDHYMLDIFGCAICECQQVRLKMTKKKIEKCKSIKDEISVKCQLRCDHLMYRVDENNCPICECCRPTLSRDCPNLKCKVYKTDNNGCPICECADEGREELAKKPDAQCSQHVNCKNSCRSGFFKSKGQCSTCECCSDNLARCSDLKCNVYKSDEEGCPVCECASFHSNKEPSMHSMVNTRCPPLNCHVDCHHVHGLLKLGSNNCHICECCDPYLDKCKDLKCKKFKTHPNSGCPVCECVE